MLDTVPEHRVEDIPHNKEKVLWALYVPFTIIVCILGIIGNIFSLCVWKRLRNKSRVGNLSTTTYFMLLSYVDIAVLVTTLFVMSLPYDNPDVTKTRAFAIFFSYVGHPLHFFLIFASIYMVVAMCLDRVRLVFWPFSRYSQNQNYTYLAISIFMGIAFFLNIPSFFEFRPEEQEDGSWKLTEIRYRHRKEFRDAVFITHCIGVIVVPWTVMFISNILLIVKSSNRLKKVRNMLSNEEEHNAEHRQLTYTLMLVSAVSLVLLAIQCIARCITMFYFVDNKIWPKIHYGRELGNLTLPLNSALNFLLFCLPGRRFRKEFRNIIRKYIYRTRQISPTSNTNTTSEPTNNPHFQTLPLGSATATKSAITMESCVTPTAHSVAN